MPSKVLTESVFVADRSLHHQLALNAYEQTFKRSNFTEAYRKTQLRRLADIFTMVYIGDPFLPTVQRNIDTFDLTNPLLASKIRDSLDRDLPSAPRAIACLKAADRYCRFLKEEHTVYIAGQKPVYLPELYGPIESPLNRYSIPRKSFERPQNENVLNKNEYRLWLKYTWEQIRPNLSPDKLLKACQLYLMCVIAGEMGLRLQEVIGLEARHFNLPDMVCLVVQGKGSKGSGYRKRSVPVTELVKQSVQDFLRMFPRKHDEPLFQNGSGGRLSKHTASHWMKELIRNIKKSGLPIFIDERFGWHAFRRTYATLFLGRGGHPYDLKRNAGWSHLSTMSHYLGSSKTSSPTSGPPLYRENG